MRKFLCTGLMALCAVLSAPAVAATDPAVAINIAGSQRMLSQRLVKAYCQLVLNVLPASARQQIDESIGRFERNLADLRGAASSPPAGAALERLGNAWRPLRHAASGVLARESAATLAAAAQEVLAAADELTRILELEARAPLGSAINAAGRQRMLSQRIAKGYMLRALGHDSPGLRGEMQAAAAEFAASLEALRANPDNSADIRRELDDLALQWEWFRSAALDSSLGFHLIVAESGEAILQTTERLTTLYQDLARRTSGAAPGRARWA